MKFSEMLKEYMDIRDDEKDPDYYDGPLHRRWEVTARKQELLDMMDEMIESAGIRSE